MCPTGGPDPDILDPARLVDVPAGTYEIGIDPDVPGASFGTYNILWQAAQCVALGLPNLYLGYWIAGSRKMAYKSRFRPIEGLLDGQWQRLQLSETTP